MTVPGNSLQTDERIPRQPDVHTLYLGTWNVSQGPRYIYSVTVKFRLMKRKKKKTIIDSKKLNINWCRDEG